MMLGPEQLKNEKNQEKQLSKDEQKKHQLKNFTKQLQHYEYIVKKDGDGDTTLKDNFRQLKLEKIKKQKGESHCEEKVCAQCDELIKKYQELRLCNKDYLKLNKESLEKMSSLCDEIGKNKKIMEKYNTLSPEEYFDLVSSQKKKFDDKIKELTKAPYLNEKNEKQNEKGFGFSEDGNKMEGEELDENPIKGDGKKQNTTQSTQQTTKPNSDQIETEQLGQNQLPNEKERSSSKPQLINYSSPDFQYESDQDSEISDSYQRIAFQKQKRRSQFVDQYYQ